MLKRFFTWLTQAGHNERIRALEKRLEEIEYEWNDWYQKFRTLHARLAKQSSREAERDAANGDHAEGAGPDRDRADEAAGVRALNQVKFPHSRRGF